MGEVDLPALVRLAARTLRHSALVPGAYQVTTGNNRRGQDHWVAGRAHQPCRRCRTLIRMVPEVTGDPERRRTWWCPRCQPGPRRRRLDIPDRELALTYVFIARWQSRAGTPVKPSPPSLRRNVGSGRMATLTRGSGGGCSGWRSGSPSRSSRPAAPAAPGSCAGCPRWSGPRGRRRRGSAERCRRWRRCAAVIRSTVSAVSTSSGGNGARLVWAAMVAARPSGVT